MSNISKLVLTEEDGTEIIHDTSNLLTKVVATLEDSSEVTLFPADDSGVRVITVPLNTLIKLQAEPE